MQNKNIVEKDPETTGSRGKEGVKYTLTSTGATMAEGLFWRDDGRSDSPEGMLLYNNGHLVEMCIHL